MTVELDQITELGMHSGHERADRSPFKINVIQPDVFATHIPPLDVLQHLAYARYTIDHKPVSMAVPVTSPLSDIYSNSQRRTAYIVATGDVEPLFETPSSEHMKAIENELRNYKTVAGFFRVDWGVYVPGQNLPNEAMILMRGHGWPTDKTIGYAGSFTPHPLLPRETNLAMLDDMLSRLYDLAAVEEFTENINVIFAPHVKSFVVESGANPVQEDSQHSLNRGDPYADWIFKNFPGYWNTDPKLFRFIPPER